MQLYNEEHYCITFLTHSPKVSEEEKDPQERMTWETCISLNFGLVQFGIHPDLVHATLIRKDLVAFFTIVSNSHYPGYSVLIHCIFCIF